MEKKEWITRYDEEKKRKIGGGFENMDADYGRKRKKKKKILSKELKTIIIT